MRRIPRLRPARLAAWCLAGALAPMALLPARAELPPEQLTYEPMKPVDGYRIYLGDPVMPHLVDGRTHVVDGSSMRYLGLLGTGFSGLTAVSRDRQTIFVATTYHSRLQRGTRTDVVEVYRAADLAFQYEVEIPPKHVQGLAMRALIDVSADDRFLLIQNATPATSVTVVDVAGRRVAAEIPTPGCYGVIPWPGRPRRFSSVCGDGTMSTFDLDEQGAPTGSQMSDRFFDPDRDPIFMHFDWVGDRLHFVSYGGMVHTVDLSGDKPSFGTPWSMVGAAERRQGWRPGGYQLFAIEPRSGRLYVAMHDKAAEGSHKSPAKQIWVFDLARQARIGRMPGQTAVSMSVARTDQPRLFVLSGADNRLVSFDVSGPRVPSKPALRSEPVGETPVYVGTP